MIRYKIGRLWVKMVKSGEIIQCKQTKYDLTYN